MDISVVIVNYNVRHFLEQCLLSVRRSVKDMNVEVLVVDNNSVDGSAAMIESDFPEVKLIQNSSNMGFAKANNQAIVQATGKYILLLNPDTLIEERTLDKCFSFMEEHSDAGAVGVKMIDGSGHFLPESKRSLPIPETAFYKVFGLSYLFPKSKIFGKYHLGYLSSNITHQVEILPGAFMMIRKETLDKIGLLDETFFMYGEDIDISYRILKAGYKNYYYPETTIIHYKGESTSKSSINYVIIFYRAMIIFAKKHFSRKHANILNFLINVAICIRATMAIMRRTVSRIFLPVADAAIIFSGYLLFTPVWDKYKSGHVSPFLNDFYMFLVPSYIFIWLVSMYFSESYEKPVRRGRVVQGIIIGTVIILAFYGLLPEDMRFSRMLIIIGMLWTLLSLTSFRYLLHLLFPRYFRLTEEAKQIIIVGEKSESESIKSILNESGINHKIIGTISIDDNKDSYYIGNASSLEEAVNINNIDEVIFCAGNIPSNKIISYMLKLSALSVEFKIFNTDSLSIIGSSSAGTSGEIYMVRFDSIVKNVNRVKKRLLDILSAVILLLLSPVLLPFVYKRRRFIRNMLDVIFGKISMVGYCNTDKENETMLPEIKHGILNPTFINNKNIKMLPEQVNMSYAKDYTIFTDISVIINGIRHLGRH